VVTEPVPHLAGSSAAIKHAPVAFPENAILIKSPMVGTFYRASEPGARPFVAIGQTVEPDATVCIIEVMKLMNSIPAGVRGVVTHIAVDDGEPVEYGQVLLAIEAA
jgi:acetyl-CoA carboxylase biotin carboxyl carrier protein